MPRLFSTADKLLDRLERFYLCQSAPAYIRDNKYWNSFLEIRELRGIGCTYSLNVCKAWTQAEPALTQQLLREEIKDLRE